MSFNQLTQIHLIFAEVHLIYLSNHHQFCPLMIYISIIIINSTGALSTAYQIPALSCLNPILINHIFMEVFDSYV